MKELRDLLEAVEAQVKKAREDFDRAAHGACRERLENLHKLLVERFDWVPPASG